MDANRPIGGAGPGHADLRSAKPVVGEDRGSITLTSVVFGLAVAITLLVGGMFIAYIGAVHQARATADLGALAAAGQVVEMKGDGQACERADAVARDNRGRVTSCEVVRAGDRVAVRVEVAVGLMWSVPGLPGEVSSVSYAGNPEESAW